MGQQVHRDTFQSTRAIRKHLNKATFSFLARVILFISLFFQAQYATAQIKITFPVSRLVVQRNNNNQATVQVAGSYGRTLDVVEARVVARALGQGTTSNWITLQTNPTNGQFNGTITVQGGWYTLQVRGQRGGAIVATDELDRFGVGEVFAILGHSNAQGSGCTVNGVDQCPTIAGASDDRVNVVALDQTSASFEQYLNTVDTNYLPGLTFSQLTTSSGMSPFAKIPWLWGHMGDVLVSRINVPILLYNAGFGGTSMEQTYWAAYDIPFSHPFVRYDLRMPYANVRNLMNLYVPTTGIRAILVQHGENDRNNPTDLTLKYYRGVIDKIRSEFNKPDLGYIIAISSYFGGVFESARSAEFQAIDPVGYKTFQGPDLDNITSQQDRPDGAHFSPTGQVKAGELWANAITDAYLAAITPYPAQMQPLTALSCAPANQLTLTQPAGYQPIWNTGSTATSLTVGAGTYSARLIDGQRKVLFPPAVVVPASVQPSKFSISSNNGTMSICSSSGLTLSSSYAGANLWSTGSSEPVIVVTTPGVYSVQAIDPVYGCLSNPVSRTVGLAATDISLSMRPSRRVVALNDTVSYQLMLRNNSGCDAGRMTIENRLPPNMTVVSTSSNLRVLAGDPSGNTKLISGSVDQLPAGQSVKSNYIVRLTAPGMYINASEVMSLTNPDTEATPANGTENGEKDEARTDLRTSLMSTAVFISPNPNQTPLPPVQSSQPGPGASEADLSLAMEASTIAVEVGKTVFFTLTVRNRGALKATHVRLSSVLPAGLTFVSSVSGMGVSNNVVSGIINQILPGQSVGMVFTAQVVAAGTFVSQAQIAASDQFDSDSTPNNGYSTGEDDEARVSLRTFDKN